MSTEFRYLQPAVSVAATDQLVINQGSPAITKRVPVGLVNTNQLNINDQTGASYTPTLADGVSTEIRMNNGSANSVVIPPNSSVAFQMGTTLRVYQYGAGTTSFTAGAGVTLRSSSATTSCRARYSVIYALKTDTNEWVVYGDKT